MNLVVSTLLIVLISLPGIVFLAAYSRPSGEPTPIAYLDSDWSRLTLGILFSIPIHAGYIYAIENWIGGYIFESHYYIHREAIVYLLSGSMDILRKEELARAVYNHLDRGFLYFTCLYLLCFVGGRLFRSAVYMWKIDQWRAKHVPFLKKYVKCDEFRVEDFYLFSFLRLSNWFYQFEGIDPNNLDEGDIGGIEAAVLVDLNDDTYLFKGMVDSYFYDTNGKLDRLVLQGAERRLIADDDTGDQSGDSRSNEDDERFYLIEGNYLNIEYSNIKTLNVNYVEEEEVEDAESDIMDLLNTLLQR